MPIDEFQKLTGLKKDKKIGSGVYGKVYTIKDKPNLVVKVQPRKYFRREAPLMVHLSRKGVTPKLKGLYQGSKMGYIIQERYNGVLGNIVNGRVKNLPGMTKDGDMNAQSRKSLRDVVKKCIEVAFFT